MYQKSQSYDVWLLRDGVQQTYFFVIKDHFLHSYPSVDAQNQNFERMKKTLEDIIILQMFTINESYDIWFFRYRVEQTKFFLSFGVIFYSLYSPNNPKNQNFEKLKKAPGDIISLDKCTKDHGICYTVP